MKNTLIIWGMSASAAFVMQTIYGAENAKIVIPSMMVGLILGIIISAIGGKK